MTTHTFTFLKSFLVRPYISVHRFKKLVQLLPVKIRKFSCLIFGAYVFALTDWPSWDSIIIVFKPQSENRIIDGRFVIFVYLENQSNNYIFTFNHIYISNKSVCVWPLFQRFLIIKNTNIAYEFKSSIIKIKCSFFTFKDETY